MAPLRQPRRVFLSHTSELQQWPADRSFVDAAKDAVNEADNVPVDMKYFTADERPPAHVCQEAVRSADVFVGIVGFRYGSSVRHCPELSYTELEFQEASKAGMTRLMFLLGKETMGPAELFVDTEPDERQQRFRNSLPNSGITICTVTSPDNLHVRLYQALVKLDRADAARSRTSEVAVPPLRDNEVNRPGLMAELVEAVTRPGTSVVGMTTGLWGTGGFGKTTLARLLVHHSDIRKEFSDEVVWVTVGEEATGPKLAEKIINAVEELSGERPGLTDPLAAGVQLGQALADRRMLLVVDDVWTSAQVEPFLIGGPAAARLFTTRDREALPGSARRVVVDVMNDNEAQQLLTTGTAEVSRAVVEGLVAATGRWPLLLALVNRAVHDYLRAGYRAEESMREILRELRMKGPSVLDIDDEQERNTAVARTIGVSLNRLPNQQRARYLELAVFQKDVAIPVPVLARYFRATAADAGWSEFQTRQYCYRLAALALVSNCHHDQVKLHDVIHAYLRQQTQDRHGELHRTLIDAHRDLVPDEGGMSAWWQLPPEQNYLWAWLPTHLHGAGLDQELRACVHHPRWLVGKLEHIGPAGLETDLALCDYSLSRVLGTVVRQNAHLLAPMNPPGSLAAILAARLPGDGPTQALVDQLIAGLTTPHLRAITPLPDLPHPALSRVLPGHTVGVSALVMAPDGSWLASASGQEVRVWDPVTGTLRHTLTGHTHGVSALVVAPDGSWLASADTSGMFLGLGPEVSNEVRIWNPITGAERHVLTGHTRGVWGLGVAPDGSWLASADGRGKVRIWDLASGAERHVLTGHTRGVWGLGVALDGSWLASADDDGKVRIWDLVTGTERCHIATGCRGVIKALVAAPDGSWLASTRDEKVRIWDPVTGAKLHTLIGHTGRVSALAAALDGSWLASAGGSALTDVELRIWDPATGAERRHIVTGHTDRVSALAVAPDGSWLASASVDGTVRIWDPITGTARQILTGHTREVETLVVAPDGSWLASAGDDEEVRIWTLDGSWRASTSNDVQAQVRDSAIGAEDRHIVIDHTGKMTALEVALNGSWLASTSHSGKVRIWDPTTGAECRHIVIDHTGWDNDHPCWAKALAVAPDGSWLASANDDGQVRIWDPVTGAARHVLTGHTSEVSALVGAPDGSWLATIDSDGEILVWDPVTGAVRHTLTDHIGWVEALVVAPDGSWLATTDEDVVVLVWDPVTGALRHTLTGHTHEVRALAVAPDGCWLASADDGGEIRIWDPTTGAPLTSLRVTDSLFHLSPTSTTITAAGKHGLYFLKFCPGAQPGQAP